MVPKAAVFEEPVAQRHAHASGFHPYPGSSPPSLVAHEKQPLCKGLQAGQVQLYLAPMRASVGMPHVPVNEEPGFSLIRDSPIRNAFGGQVIGSTARLRRPTSGSESPLKS